MSLNVKSFLSRSRFDWKCKIKLNCWSSFQWTYFKYNFYTTLHLTNIYLHLTASTKDHLILQYLLTRWNCSRLIYDNDWLEISFKTYKINHLVFVFICICYYCSLKSQTDWLYVSLQTSASVGGLTWGLTNSKWSIT